MFIQDHHTGWARAARFGEKFRRIEISLPRAGLAGAEVPRQNTQLWELILGNYNPGDSTAVRGPTRADSEKHRQYRNVQIDLSSFIY